MPAYANRFVILFVLAAPVLLALVPQKQAPGKAPSPVTLVSRAERLLQKGDKEDAQLMLWQVLDLLRGKASNPVEEATLLSARFLLKESDILELERRAAFTQVAALQTEIAKSYRIKKWYGAARGRLDVAVQYDPEVIAKESKILTAKRKKGNANSKPASKPGKPKPAASKVSSLLRPKAIKVQLGPWVETDQGISVERKNTVGQCEWICEDTHEENEFVVEIKPSDPKVDWNAAIGVGLNVLEGSNHHSGYRCHVQYHPEVKAFQLYVWHINGNDSKQLVNKPAACVAAKDGYHRFAVRVIDGRLELEVDGEPTVTVDVKGPVRGHFGLMHGVSNKPSCGVAFRNFRKGPLPVDAPTDEEVREQVLEATQHAITTAVEGAKTLLAAKKNEPAARKLRDALMQLYDLPAGILRSNLQKSITTMLTKSDKVAKKRDRAAKACAKTLGELADKYSGNSCPRLALVIARKAMQFDWVGQSKRLEAVEQAIVEWNNAQLTAHAAELAAPKDDGKMLRDWFANNRLLDSRSFPWKVDGPGARSELPGDRFTVLMPAKNTLPAGTVDVHLRLPTAQCQAGIAFDAAGPHDYCLAILTRNKNQLVLGIARWAGGKWIYLDNKQIPLDPWRLEAWHHMQLETVATGIKVKVLDTEIKIPRVRLGNVNGRIGLFAGNMSKHIATIEIRGFAAKAK